MRGKVECRFVGGPKGEETLTLAAMACGDTLALGHDTWMAQASDGSIRIMTSPRGPRAPWIAYLRDTYEKVKPVEPGNVTYRFVRTEEVSRCEKLLEKQNRRCRNEALPGSPFCRTHGRAL